jgi:hypothetical protein
MSSGVVEEKLSSRHIDILRKKNHRLAEICAPLPSKTFKI